MFFCLKNAARPIFGTSLTAKEDRMIDPQLVMSSCDLKALPIRKIKKPSLKDGSIFEQ